jgi:hypothetical protein
MLYRLLADAVLIAHLAFVIFVLFGGVLVSRYPHLLRIHLPALLWGIVVQWANWVCPLTPLENRLRQLGGEEGYSGGFVEHIVSKVLYPEHLPLELRYFLGLALIGVNTAIYGYVLFCKRQHKHISRA